MKLKNSAINTLKWNEDVKFAITVLTTFTLLMALSCAVVLTFTLYAR
jgi:hypothetical protein